MSVSVPSSQSIIECINIAEERALTDLSGATEFIISMNTHPAFYPWGAHCLLKLLRKAGEFQQARELSVDLLYRAPNLVIGWTQALDLARDTSNYTTVANFVLDRLKDQNLISEIYFQAHYLEVALFAASTRCDAIMAGGLAGALFDENIVNGVLTLSPIVAAVRGFMDQCKTPNLPLSWRLAVMATEDQCLEVDGVLIINLAMLGLQRLGGWEVALARPLINALRAVVGWRPYSNDDGFTSIPHVCAKNYHEVILWRLLVVEAESGPTTMKPKASDGIACFRPGELWVRPGSVEFWALSNYLENGRETLISAEAVARELYAKRETGKELISQEDRWWPRMSARENILRLAVNAGWYAKPGKGSCAFADWADRYASALSEGNLLLACEPEILRTAALLPGLRRDWRTFRAHKLLSHLDGADVVFATAFADEIAEHHELGRIDALWKDCGIRERVRSLRTVPAPMSIWPYYPNDSWTHSFELLRAECAHAVREMKATVFLASCGSYGLPLVHDIHKQFGITAIYYGHAMNMFFGIYTDAFSSVPFFATTASSPHWRHVNLAERYETISRIDGGRYVSR